jgi:hypothetical protein
MDKNRITLVASSAVFIGMAVSFYFVCFEEVDITKETTEMVTVANREAVPNTLSQQS